MQKFRQALLAGSAVALIVFLVGLALGNAGLWQPAALIACVLFAPGLGAIPALGGYQYTAWILTAVVAGLLYPQELLYVGDFDLRNKWLILFVVQAVMFGMGTQMSLRDFSDVVRSPRGVLIGMVCQFTIMPFSGYFIARAFGFEPEIAAGIILIGACSSGLASNVMAYIARANLALSVTVTAVATLAAPLATPFMMKLLAGTMVEVVFLGMMLQIIKIVVVPIGSAMLHDYLKTASATGWKVVGFLALLSLAWLGSLALGAWGFWTAHAPESLLPFIGIVGFVAGAIVIGLVYHLLVRGLPQIERLMPLLSMVGIVYFTTVTTAAGRDDLLRVGLLLFAAAVIHNAAGYILGYWMSRLLGLDRNSARTVSLEVGLQNGGMASGIAGSMGMLGTLGLASAVFSPWMNISGSILANYWQKHPVDKPSSE
ncbi:MAG: bile acid:sodium symporter family protein [Verrucomicrobiota bacterium JB022]|nr:bile acid:sodium symporter family protein [Verrucomicrobiota bacterium JB022]